MYEDIRKPAMLRHVPLTIIRPLPCLYYYSVYAARDIPQETKTLFSKNCDFMKEALSTLAEKMELKKFDTLAGLFADLGVLPVPEIKNKLATLTVDLSEVCGHNHDKLRLIMKDLRAEFKDLYRKMVPSLRVLVVKQENEPPGAEKLATTLRDFCAYDVSCATQEDREHLDLILKAHVVLFSSVLSPQIHRVVQELETYRKPGLAVVRPEEGQAAIRHAAQLSRSGFQVLIKMLTPIRLFTTIDKLYMHYALSSIFAAEHV